MKKSNKILITFMIVGIFIFTCIIFNTYILELILRPLSLVLWILLRIFVLSIDQKIFWGIIIFGIVFLLIYRISKLSFPEELEKQPLSKNIYLQDLDFWRLCFSVDINDFEEMKTLKLKLAEILVTVYASNKRIQVNYELFDAFKNRVVEIPDSIYNFLFYKESKKKWFCPVKWIQRITGSNVKKYYYNLENCLNFIEDFSNDKNIL